MVQAALKRTLSEPKVAATLLAGFRLNDGAAVAKRDLLGLSASRRGGVWGWKQKGGTVHVVGLGL